MERFFGWIWRSSPERFRRRPGHVQLEDKRTRLETFAAICNPDLPTVTVGGSLWAVGFVGTELLLPREVAWSPDAELNLRLLQGLILRASAVRSLGLTLSFHDRSRVAPRLAVLAAMPSLNRWLDARFPGYRDWEQELFSSADSLWRIGSPWEVELRALWRVLIMERSDHYAAEAAIRLLRLQKTMKRNGDPPDFLHATIPLPYRPALMGAPNVEGCGRKSDNSNVESEKSRSQKEVAEIADTDGPENPVIHSFEKTEALDDYDGGRRAQSGDDELDSHAAALEELELSRLTRSGQSSSIYRQDAVAAGLGVGQESRGDGVSDTFVTYPEWSLNENRYWRGHCAVYPRVEPEMGNGAKVRAGFDSDYTQIIRVCRARLSRQLNTPLWKSRQSEGPELDLDNLVRLKSEFHVGSDRPLVFARKWKSERDFTLAFLVDSSYSTDSFVAGKRVMDTFHAAIGVCGLLLEGLIDRVMVASASSSTRRHVHYRIFKDFGESWDCFYGRLERLQPEQYTRLGPAIRHAAGLLAKERAAHPVLILLTDGKPTDLDRYEGPHGEEDVRMAVLEAEAKGIHVLALTVSDLDASRLKRMFRRNWPIDGPQALFDAVLGQLREIGFR